VWGWGRLWCEREFRDDGSILGREALMVLVGSL
jgi:hypothetical protein